MSLKKFVKRLLLKLFKVTTEEVTEIAIEELRSKWPAVSAHARLIVDGLEYIITSVDDRFVEARRIEGGRKQVITTNLKDLTYNSQLDIWQLPGR